MIVRAVGYAAATGLLFAVSPAWPLLVLLPVGAVAVALAARGTLRPWTDLAGGLAAAASAYFAGAPQDGLPGFLAIGAVVLLAACAVLPSASAPKGRAAPVGIAWLAVGAVVALAIWLPAWLAARGRLAPLDPVTAPGLLVRSGAILALLALVLVGWSVVRRLTRKAVQHDETPPAQV